MPLVLLNQGEVFILGQIAGANLTLHLFSNAHEPAEDDDDSDYVEVDGGGYAAIALPFVGWTITPGSPSVMEFSRCDFVFSGVPSVPTVYGYYVKMNGTTILWAERAPTLFTVAQAGDEYRVTPRFTQE